jgi:hypothetical protein
VSLLPPGYVAAQRQRAELSLTDLCDIWEYTAISDLEGGQTDTWSETQSDIPCRVAPGGLSPREQIVAQKLRAERVYTVTLPAETAIDERDRIVWRGDTYEVKSVAKETTQFLQQVMVELT